ncbi:MAG: 2-C-methyl-D-erythritol 4-phosphate cytidylyltransferase [Angelakisella sp.]
MGDLLPGNRKAGVSGKRRRAPAASEGRTACGTQAAGPRQSGGRPPQEGEKSDGKRHHTGGGSSTRYGTGENKTLVELLGRPVLEYSLRVFLAADVVDEVVLAAKAGEEAALRKLAEGLCLQKPVTVVTGGADRAASVEKALAAAGAKWCSSRMGRGRW